MRASSKQDDLVVEGEPHRDKHPVARYLDGLAPGSRRTLRQALDRIAGLLTRGRARAETLAWQNLKPRHASSLRATLLKHYSAATTNKMLSAFRGVLREACAMGQVSEADLRKMANTPSVRNERLSTGRTLADKELKALFATCAKGGGPAACRDAALLALLYGAGLRRSEAVALALRDYDHGSGLLLIHDGHDRQMRLEAGARLAVESWIKLRGREAGALLCPVDKAGRVRVRHMTDQAVLYIVRRRAEVAGIQRFSPHDLRRTYFFRMRRSKRLDRKAVRGRARDDLVPPTTLPVPFQGCNAK